MNIFDKVKPNPEVELMVMLKYGEPKEDMEYVNRLPIVVVIESLQRIENVTGWRRPSGPQPSETELRNQLYIILGWNTKVPSIIKEVLAQYHTILGHV